MNIKNILYVFSLLICLSCNRYLELKSIKQTAVPDRLEDLEALLANQRTINGNSPGVLEGITDNYYVSRADWAARQENDRNVYTWHPHIQTLPYWDVLYGGPIYYSNVILDQLEQMSPSEEPEKYNRIKGSALFHRAYNFFFLAQLFCDIYSAENLDAPGIPLRSTGSITVPVIRNTIGETYQQIIEDLRLAAELLPTQTMMPIYPKKAAAYAALARVYLLMGDFDNSLFFTNKALSEHHALVDLNKTIDGEAPFKQFNEETIFFSYVTTNFILMNASRVRVDTLLYASYDDFDLRKNHYFKPSTGNNLGSFHFNCFEGRSNNQMVFTGIMTSELYITQAECLVRLGRFEEATESLHTLLRTRFDLSTSPYRLPVLNGDDALSIVLAERRKELVNRGLRWMDLRRLNADGANITLKRVLGDEVFELPPGDPRWILLIPDEVIVRSGLIQNPR